MTEDSTQIPGSPTPETVAARVAALEEAFRRVDREHMQDMPLRNPALSVEAVGFRPWGLARGTALLGVIITPWCMNLILLPYDPAAFEAPDDGVKEVHELPCGGVEFTAGRLEGIGPYLMCSLFSPMHQFGDQEGARLTAELALDDVLKPPAEPAPQPAQRRRRLEGPPPNGGPDLSRRAALGLGRAPRGRDPGR